MSTALPIPAVCPACGGQVNTQIPGPQGPAGVNGTNGSNGENAFTTLGANLTMPAADGVTPVNATVVSSHAFVVGQIVFVQFLGHLKITVIPDGVTLTLVNPAVSGAYSGNAVPGTIAPVGSAVSPAGLQGPAGALSGAAGGDLAGNYPNPTLAAIGGASTVGDSSHVAAVSVDTKGRVTALAAVGINFPTSLPPNGAAGGDLAGNYPNPTLGNSGVTAASYGDSQNIPQLTVDAKGRLTAAANVAANPRYGRLGFLTNVNLNAGATDTAIAINSTRYRLDRITVDNASVNLTLATAGVFTGPGATGTTLAADQALSALSASSKFKDLTLTPSPPTDVVTSATIYFRVGTAQGAAATANVSVWGWRLE